MMQTDRGQSSVNTVHASRTIVRRADIQAGEQHVDGPLLSTLPPAPPSAASDSCAASSFLQVGMFRRQPPGP